MIDLTQVLVRPLLTEKSVAAAKLNKYVFEIAPRANKVEVRAAVEHLFPGTRVSSVHTMTVKGKVRRMSGYAQRGRRRQGKSSDWKKAIVTLKEGKIPLFEGV
jgi:large subunit ribosomal protein L23